MASKLSKAVFDRAAASVGQSEPMTHAEFVFELYDSAANELKVPNPLPETIKPAVWWSRLKPKRVMMPHVGDLFFVGGKDGNLMCGIVGGIMKTNILTIEASEQTSAVITNVRCLGEIKGFIAL